MLKLPGRYDLGFVRQSDGSYQFLANNELIGGRAGSDGYEHVAEQHKTWQ